MRKIVSEKCGITSAVADEKPWPFCLLGREVVSCARSSSCATTFHELNSNVYRCVSVTKFPKAMRCKLTLSATVLVFLCASCSVLSSDTGAEQLIGSWRWLNSTGGFAGWTISPDSTGYSERLVRFRPDNSFSAYRADTLFQSGRYSLEQTDGETIVSYETSDDEWLPRQRVEFKGKDTLVLVDLCDDCYRSTYHRAE